MPPITIETASGDSFTANQRGTIQIEITSDPIHNLPKVSITLTNVIYALKLKANLLLVGRMTSSNVDVVFSKHTSSLTHNGKVLAHGPKVNNLSTYVASSATPKPHTSANYSTEPSDLSIWHHRLTHTSYSTLETMKRLDSATSFNPKS